MKRISIYDLPFKDDLMYFAEAMVYAFSRTPITIKGLRDQKSWIDEIRALISFKVKVVAQIMEAKQQYSEQLANSPLLLGLLDMYLAAAKDLTGKNLKAAYKNYETLQQGYSFEKNMNAFIDAGVTLSFDDWENHTDLCLAYPIHLYGVYRKHGGGNNYEHRGYYLPICSCHKLDKKQLKKLCETNPDFLQYPEVKDFYESLMGGDSSMKEESADEELGE